jgi:peptide-methionine (R)-S-oxide reductase
MSDQTKVKPPTVIKSEDEWRAQLSPEQFYVTRLHGTEPAFSGPHWNEKAAGLYSCVCCGEPLFGSETKFNSRTGWPSYYAPVTSEAVSEYPERMLFFIRQTEVRCAKCDAHLGHVFRDDPRPTGLRYCINGHALSFAAKDKT